MIADNPYKNDSPANPNICILSLPAVTGISHCAAFTAAAARGFSSSFIFDHISYNRCNNSNKNNAYNNCRNIIQQPCHHKTPPFRSLIYRVSHFQCICGSIPCRRYNQFTFHRFSSRSGLISFYAFAPILVVSLLDSLYGLNSI